MYHHRIDVAMFVLSIGTISAGHKGQLRRRGSAWIDVIVVQLASWSVNYSGREAYGGARATRAGTRWVGETSYWHACQIVDRCSKHLAGT